MELKSFVVLIASPWPKFYLVLHFRHAPHQRQYSKNSSRLWPWIGAWLRTGTGPCRSGPPCLKGDPTLFPQVRKWTIQQLRRYLTAKHGRESVRRLFEEIDNIFVFSLQSVQKVIINDKQSFELYGYDILLDRDLKPYVYLWCWMCGVMWGCGRI